MRTNLIIISIVLTSFSNILAQLYDNTWVLGYGEKFISPSTGIVQGGILMNFGTEPPGLTWLSILSHEQHACISNKSGQLIAYTDGCKIYNQNHQIMMNGDTINPGEVYNNFCTPYSGYPLWQGSLFLPKPGNENLYYLFHLRDDDWLWNPMNLMYSIIDITGDNGNGNVILKNQSIFSDSIYLNNYLTATRHANGRDWWIVTPRRWQNKIHVSLLTPDGVEYKGLQDIEFSEVDSAYCCAQTCFSSDGSKYFKNSPHGLLKLDFDRCTGLFSNPVHLDYTKGPNGSGGVSVSPNNRFLYLTAKDTVFQYDLFASDLKTSGQVVAVYDGFVSPFNTTFFQAMLAPNGKIYFIAGSSNNVLHVINNPDSMGSACDVQQHGILLPALNHYIMPNMANYRLGALSGSFCDTLIGVSIKTLQEHYNSLKISPNPAKNWISVELPIVTVGSWEIKDWQGREILNGTFPYTKSFDVGIPGLSSGNYIIIVSTIDKQKYIQKISINN